MNLKDYKPIIDALMDGKTVQSCDPPNNEWFTQHWVNLFYRIGIGFKPDRFRVKPEPREWWMCFNCPDRWLFLPAKPTCTNCDSEIIHVREVLKEDK